MYLSCTLSTSTSSARLASTSLFSPLSPSLLDEAAAESAQSAIKDLLCHTTKDLTQWLSKNRNLILSTMRKRIPKSTSLVSSPK